MGGDNIRTCVRSWHCRNRPRLDRGGLRDAGPRVLRNPDASRALGGAESAGSRVLEAARMRRALTSIVGLSRRTAGNTAFAVARSIGDDPDKSGSGVRDVTRIWVSGVRGVLLHLRSSNSACRISCGRDTSRSRQRQHDLRVMPRGAPGTAPRCSRVLFVFDSRWNPRAQ
jgi:hypothetical protein